MPKGIPNKRYTPEFEKLVVETMPKEKLSYRKAARQFEISSDKRVAAWEGIYLEEGPEGLAVERYQGAAPTENFASVSESPAFFALVSLVFQNQGLQVF